MSTENPPLLEYHPLSFKVKFAYGVGHVLNDLCASMWFSYLLVYFHLVLQYSNKLSGIILLVGQVADGICTPFVGLEADKVDNFWPFKYGRRKTWHLIGTVCVIISFPFLFIKCIGCEKSHQWAQLIYYSSFAIIFQFGWASVQVSHLSLIPDMTEDPHERTELNAIRYAFTVISNIFVYSLTWLVIGISTDQSIHDVIGPEDVLKFEHIVFIIVGVGIIFSLIFHTQVKEASPDLLDGSFGGSVSISSSGRVMMSWRDWLKEMQFYQVAVVYMSTRLFVNMSQVYIPLYLQDTLKLHETSIAIIPLVVFISGFLSTFFIKYLHKKAGRKITYLFGSLIGLSACVWLYFGTGKDFSHFQLYFVASFLGIGGCTMLITSLSITSDLIGSNVRFSAFIFGAMSFFDKIANGVAVLYVQMNIFCTSCCPECSSYYRFVLSYGCGGSVLLALLALATLAPATLGARKKVSLLLDDSSSCNNILEDNQANGDIPETQVTDTINSNHSLVIN